MASLGDFPRLRRYFLVPFRALPQLVELPDGCSTRKQRAKFQQVLCWGTHPKPEYLQQKAG